MIVKILTGRPEKYAFAGLLTESGVEFCSSAEDLIGEEADVVIVDPEELENDSSAAAFIRRRNSSGKKTIISSPERKKSLYRELRATGLLDPEGVNEEKKTAGEWDQKSRREGEPDRRPVRPSFRRKIGVIGLSELAAQGFVTMLLAEELASESAEDGSLVTVFSPENDYYYHALKRGRSFEAVPFRDVVEVMGEWSEYGPDNHKGRPVNLCDGISWATGSTQKEDRELAEGWSSMVDRLEGNHVICEFSSGQFRREAVSAGGYLDALLVIADPFPSSMGKESSCLEMVRSCGVPAVHAVSCMNDSVKTEVMQEFLGTNEIIYLPFVDPAAVCEAEYRGENPYRIDRIRRLTMPSVCEMIEKLDRITGRF